MFLDSLSQKFVYTLLQLTWLYTFQGYHQLYISEYRLIYTLLVSSLLVTQLFPMFDSSLEHSSLLSWQLFHFSLLRASCKVFGIGMVFIFERKVLYDGENFSNDIKLAIRYKGFLVHSLIPFLIAIG